ncbi:MAG: hypothetical protein BWK76_05105 [Desulfobulbaceae bacterium A2]|nr:MAG: hypothetical protein BWK76_05105 [Desulfobulbaceae bacterium A2]
MKPLLGSMVIAGALLCQVTGVLAQERRLTRDYLADIVKEARKKFHVPAIAVTVMDAEQVYLQIVQGVRRVDGHEDATMEDFFHIGSCSKSVLALLAAQLVEQHKISWQTKFFAVLPELAADAHEAYRDITLEDLFLCRAGIKAFTSAALEPLPQYGPEVSDPRQAFIKNLIAHPPASPREGTVFRHLYSNAGYTMAAAMLERVSGLRYEEMVRQLVTNELGIPLHIGWPNSIGPEQPWGHLLTQGGIESFPPEHDYKLPVLLTPAGDLSMTPPGFALYTQRHLRGLRGQDDFLPPAAYQHQHFGYDGFSLGVANGNWGSQRYSGFDGSAGTFFCRAIIVPEADFAFTIMTNAGSGTGTMEAVDWLSSRIVKQHFNWWWKFWL